MMFALTVDAEADNQWDHGIPLTTENVRYWEPFQSICSKHGVPPTYLVTSEITADPLAQSLLRRWVIAGEAEVGAHLHPWTTPPFLDTPGYGFNDSAHAFVSELPRELVQAKLENLTAEIQLNLGVRPTAFRAGRYGLDHQCARELARLGYLVDSSVTPMTNWNADPGLPDGAGGPDFTSHTARPFYIEGTGDVGLVEIPVTVVPTYLLMLHFPIFLRLYETLPGRGVQSLFRRWLCPQPVWLQPVHTHFRQSDLQRAYECQSRDSDVSVMMLHSSELMPGGSPSTPTEASVREVLDRLDAFLGFMRSHGAVPATLSQAALQLRLSGRLDSRQL